MEALKGNGEALKNKVTVLKRRKGVKWSWDALKYDREASKGDDE